MRKRYQAGEKLERLIERCAGLSEENRFLARSLQLEFMTNVSDYSDQLVTYIEKGLLLPKTDSCMRLSITASTFLALGKLTETETFSVRVLLCTESLTFKVYGEFLRGQCCYYRTEFSAAITCFEHGIWLLLCHALPVEKRWEEKEKVRLERVVDGGFGELLGMILYMKGMTHLGIGENKEAAQTIELLEDVVKETRKALRSFCSVWSK